MSLTLKVNSKPKNLSNLSFIKHYINSKKYFRPSPLDILFKAIINNNRTPLLKPYLNMLRIIYFLNRLSKKDLVESKKLKSKLTLRFKRLSLLIYYLELLSTSSLRSRDIDLDYKAYKARFIEDPTLEKEFLELEEYLLYYSILFKDFSK
jgi:hypothetical protein